MQDTTSKSTTTLTKRKKRSIFDMYKQPPPNREEKKVLRLKALEQAKKDQRVQELAAMHARGAIVQARKDRKKAAEKALTRKQKKEKPMVATHLGFRRKPELKWAPHPYQKRAVKFLLDHGAAGLFLDPGLGKTSITLGAIKVLKKKGIIGNVLIVAPLRVIHNVWPQEIKKWKDFSQLKATILHGSGKETALKETDSDIFLINPEGLPWLLAEKARLKKLGIDTLVIDESSKFKNGQGKRFKLLKGFLKDFKKRWILTGSPAPNTLMDLHAQIFLLDLGHALYPYITRFRQEYFIPVGFDGRDWKLKVDADKRIYEAIKPLVLRLEGGDYLDLPQIIYNDIRIELPDKAMKVYKQMEDLLFAELDGDREATAVSAASASMKCRQIASGGLYYNDMEAATSTLKRDQWAHIHDAKTEALMDLIEELSGQPILVAYEFKHDLDRLQQALGKDVPYIGGGTSAKDTADIIRRWNNNEIPVLLGQPASMGHGLNLQGGDCRTVAWYSMSWNFELYDQFIRRVARQGSQHKFVTVHHLIAEKTIDMAMKFALISKRTTQGDLLEALKVYRKIR